MFKRDYYYDTDITEFIIQEVEDKTKSYSTFEEFKTKVVDPMNNFDRLVDGEDEEPRRGDIFESYWHNKVT